MWWFWGMLVCFGISFLLMLSIEKDRKAEIDRGIMFSDHFAKYMGGFPDVAGDKNICIGVTSNCVFIDFTNEINNVRQILYSNLINAEIISENSLISQVNMGKLIVFGLLAFAMQDKKTITDNYLLIKYKELEQIRNIVIKTQRLEELVRTINSQKLIYENNLEK